MYILYVRSRYSTYVRMCVMHPPTHLQGICKQLVHSIRQGGARGQQLEIGKQKATTRRRSDLVEWARNCVSEPS